MVLKAVTADKITDIAPRSVPVVPSDEVQNSHDDVVTTTSPSYIKVKEILLNEKIATGCRIKFALRSEDPYNRSIAYGKIYMNGSPVGTERGAVNDWYTFSEDFGEIAAGTYIQLYMKYYEGGAYTNAQGKELRICYSTDPNAKRETTITV